MKKPLKILLDELDGLMIQDVIKIASYETILKLINDLEK